MAQEITTPTFKEALKQDKAQFDDCTPCRIVGRAPNLLLLRFIACGVSGFAVSNNLSQEVQPSSASVHSHTFPATRNSKRTKQLYEQAKACLEWAAEERR